MDCLLPGWENPPQSHSVIFDSLNAAVIRSAALKTKGAAGLLTAGVDCAPLSKVPQVSFVLLWLCLLAVSGLHSFLQIFCHFSNHSVSLLLTSIPCSVPPIGMCEVVRRIIAKAALSIIRDDIQASAGSFQLCAGQLAGAEAAIHSVCSLFACSDCDIILLVDASNAFNSLNCIVALHNICHSTYQHLLFSCFLIYFW